MTAVSTIDALTTCTVMKQIRALAKYMDTSISGFDAAIATINNRLTTAETNIGTNASGIAKNVSDIAKLDARLTTTTTNLATLTTEAGALVKDIGFSGDASTVKSTITTKAGTSRDVPLPVADATKSGVMSKAIYDGIDLMKADIEKLKLVKIPYKVTFPNATPTQAEILQAYKQYNPTAPAIPVVGTYVIDYAKNLAYTYDGTTWQKDPSPDSVAPFTQEYSGTIKGSNVAGQVHAEIDGTGSVNGWDKTQTDINNISTVAVDTIVVSQSGKVPATSPNGGLDIAVGQITGVGFTEHIKNVADVSGAGDNGTISREQFDKINNVKMPKLILNTSADLENILIKSPEPISTLVSSTTRSYNYPAFTSLYSIIITEDSIKYYPLKVAMQTYQTNKYAELSSEKLNNLIFNVSLPFVYSSNTQPYIQSSRYNYLNFDVGIKMKGYCTLGVVDTGPTKLITIKEKIFITLVFTESGKIKILSNNLPSGQYPVEPSMQFALYDLNLEVFT